jgi:hypothetical protein
MTSQQPPAMIDDVIARMRQLDDTLPTQERHDQGAFRSPGFLARLDVAFADLYFRAYHEVEAGNPHAVSKAWAPLFAARRKSAIAPIQFALAGMNAHINYDLEWTLFRGRLWAFVVRPGKEGPSRASNPTCVSGVVPARSG